MYVWDVNSRSLQYKLPGHIGSVNEVQFYPDIKDPIGNFIFYQNIGNIPSEIFSTQNYGGMKISIVLNFFFGKFIENYGIFFENFGKLFYKIYRKRVRWGYG